MSYAVIKKNISEYKKLVADANAVYDEHITRIKGTYNPNSSQYKEFTEKALKEKNQALADAKEKYKDTTLQAYKDMRNTISDLVTVSPSEELVKTLNLINIETCTDAEKNLLKAKYHGNYMNDKLLGIKFHDRNVRSVDGILENIDIFENLTNKYFNGTLGEYQRRVLEYDTTFDDCENEINDFVTAYSN